MVLRGKKYSNPNHTNQEIQNRPTETQLPCLSLQAEPFYLTLLHCLNFCFTSNLKNATSEKQRSTMKLPNAPTIPSSFLHSPLYEEKTEEPAMIHEAENPMAGHR